MWKRRQRRIALFGLLVGVGEGNWDGNGIIPWRVASVLVTDMIAG